MLRGAYFERGREAEVGGRRLRRVEEQRLNDGRGRGREGRGADFDRCGWAEFERGII